MASILSTATSRLRPVWLSDVPPSTTPTLSEDIAAEIVLVGGGISALTTAWMMQQSGKQVTVLIPQDLRSGIAAQSSAHLSTALPMRYHQLEYLHGAEGARMVASSHLAGIELLEQLVRKEHLDCGFSRLDGYLMVPPGESLQELEREYAAIQRVGLRQVRWVDDVPIQGFLSGRALHFPEQAQFHPVRYLTQLSARIIAGGGRIFANTPVSAISPGASIAIRTAAGHQVRCEALVWAADAPLGALLPGEPRVLQTTYDHHVIAARIPAAALTPMLLRDTAFADHHARIAHLGGDGVNTPQHVLIVNARHAQSADAPSNEQRFRLLELWALERFPMIERIEYRWHWQAQSASDGLVDIGRYGTASESIFVGGDDTGTSVTHGFISALINSSLLVGRTHAWSGLYAPNRRALRAGTPAKPAVALPSYSDFLPNDERIPRGSGMVLRRGLSEIAVYVDASGKRYERSAKCPHLGCTVEWNAARKGWDCPCHGCSFDALGHVLCGPADRDLEVIATPRLPMLTAAPSAAKRETQSLPQPKTTRQS